MDEKEIMIDFLSKVKIRINGKDYPKEAFSYLNDEQLLEILRADDMLYEAYEAYRLEKETESRKKIAFIELVSEMTKENQSDFLAPRLAKVLEDLPFNAVSTKTLMGYMKTFNDYNMLESALVMGTYIMSQMEYNEKKAE